MLHKLSALIQICIFLSLNGLFGQQTIQFPAIDSLPVSAHFYYKDATLPILICLHQQNRNKADYKETALKISHLGYNVLAIDLRNGKSTGSHENQTAGEFNKPENRHLSNNPENDILAAIHYAYEKSKQPVLILAPEIYASFALSSAKADKRVKGLVVLSPFRYNPYNGTDLMNLKPYTKPVLLLASKDEKSLVEFDELVPANILMKISFPKELRQLGTDIFTDSSMEAKNIWLQMMPFFERMKDPVPYLN